MPAPKENSGFIFPFLVLINLVPLVIMLAIMIGVSLMVGKWTHKLYVKRHPPKLYGRARILAERRKQQQGE